MGRDRTRIGVGVGVGSQTRIVINNIKSTRGVNGRWFLVTSTKRQIPLLKFLGKTFRGFVYLLHDTPPMSGPGVRSEDSSHGTLESGQGIKEVWVYRSKRNCLPLMLSIEWSICSTNTPHLLSCVDYFNLGKDHGSLCEVDDDIDKDMNPNHVLK